MCIEHFIDCAKSRCIKKDPRPHATVRIYIYYTRIPFFTVIGIVL